MIDLPDGLDALGFSEEKRKLLAYLLMEEDVAPLPAQRIVPRRDAGDPPLSFAQQRLWVLDQLAPGTDAYNVPSAVRLSGAIRLAALRRAIGRIVQRHEALRTTFGMRGEQPVQVIAARLRAPLPVFDLRGLPPDRREAAALDLAHAEARLPFDLARGPLLRTILLRLAADEHILLANMHHIVADGWSLGVFLRDLAALYEALAYGRPARLPDLPIQYADYAVWQRAWLSGDALDAQLSYWRRQLAGPGGQGGPPPLDLPADRARLPQPGGRGVSHPLSIARDRLDALLALGAQADATLFMALLAAFDVLLRWQTGQDDIVIGADIANRTRSEVADLIGFFVNLLVMRVDLSGDPSFREILARVRAVCLDAYAHQDLPFEMLVDALQPTREVGRAPLVQVVIVLQNAPLPPVALPDLTLEPIDIEIGAAKFDLVLNLHETPQGLRGALKYQADLFEAATIARMAALFEGLLEQAASRPDARLHELTAWLDEAARQLQIAHVQQLKAARQQAFQSRKRRSVGRVAQQGDDQP